MRLVKVGAASVNQIPLDWEGNYNRIVAAIKEAEERGVNFLCLPELCITGYGCEDAFLSHYVAEKAWEILIRLTRLQTNVVFSVGLPVRWNNALYNCSAIVGRKSYNSYNVYVRDILYITAKKNLASDGIHYESRWFKPWRDNYTSEVNGYFIGDAVIEIDGIKIGFEICEDAWVANRPGISLASQGVDIIFNPSASHFAFGKSETRKRFVLEGSRAFHCTYVYANLLGNEAGRIIYDGDTIIASNGVLLSSGQRLSFKNHMLSTAVIDVDQNRTAKCTDGSYHPCDGECKQVSNYALLQPTLSNKDNIITNDNQSKFEEFGKASSLALWDYMRKSKSNGFVLSLSGGADSSAVAIMVHMMVQNVMYYNKEAMLNYFGVESDEKIMEKVLTCIYQKTKNSSEATLESAKTLSKQLGATFDWFSVDGLVNDYLSIIKGVLNTELTWEKDDIALQNIQARVRAPGVWMIANIKNALLLTTSNRSEAAVGYATMDGDTCGGLAPIAGIDKQFILEWLVYLSEREWKYKEGLVDYRKLVPSAELRPLEQNQVDEDDLMPYWALEAIEEKAIRDKLSPKECFDYFRSMNVFPLVEDERLVGWIEKFFKLWSRNQWKRERYAPSFHFDDENLDPRSWCRWPILNSGMVEELKEIK
jgi:NAD+ synthase (glutamine-hydrolysing)